VVIAEKNTNKAAAFMPLKSGDTINPAPINDKNINTGNDLRNFSFSRVTEKIATNMGDEKFKITAEDKGISWMPKKNRLIPKKPKKLRNASSL